MTLFVTEIVTAAVTALPITVDAADEALAAAVVEEIERTYPVAGHREPGAPHRD